MTTNQINYAKLVEDQRHNQVSEQISRLAHEENVRSNLAREVESNRSNLANESIRARQNDITDRHYLRSDQENQRHNVASEQLIGTQNAIAARDSNVRAQLANAQSEQYTANAGYLSGKGERESRSADIQSQQAMNQSSTVGQNAVRLGSDLTEANSRNDLRESESGLNRARTAYEFTKILDTVWDDLAGLLRPSRR